MRSILPVPEQDEWLSVDEIAKNLKMDVETVRNWIRRKQLKAYRFGRDYRIRREDFDAFVRERATTDGDER
jgi:excisionase family DNA binding protein